MLPTHPPCPLHDWCTPCCLVTRVRRFEARVVVLDVAIPVLRGQQVTIHAHTGEALYPSIAMHAGCS